MQPRHLPRFEAGAARTMAEAIACWAADRSEAVALVIETAAETKTVTYGDLWRAAERCAAGLCARFQCGDRIVLAYPAGEAFVVALLGCFLSGMIATPSPPPRRGRREARLIGIVADCAAAAVLTTPELAREAEPVGAPLLSLEGIDGDPQEHRRHAIAFIQYTSGSTADPKGVIVTHDALWANEAVIRTAFGHAEGMTLVGWLPNHHDMGLVGNILQPLYCGGTSVILSPQQFLKRPLSWLEAVSRHRAHTSGAPNFAYDLCVRAAAGADVSKLDLSRWVVAFNGAEPVRAETVRRFCARFEEARFDPEALIACYGLAESTLMVSGARRDGGATVRRFDPAALAEGRLKAAAPDKPALENVSCGAPLGAVVAIKDAATGASMDNGAVGEVWVSGPSLGGGYWNRAGESAAVFPVHDGRRWLRTGDLGALIEGELHLVGRLKDVIIQQGQNAYPSDIEAAIASVIPEAVPGGVAAFGVAVADGEAVVVLIELERDALREADLGRLLQRTRMASAHALGVPVAAAVALAPGGIPKTSSGKPRRAEARRLFLSGALRGLVAADEGVDRLRRRAAL